MSKETRNEEVCRNKLIGRIGPTKKKKKKRKQDAFYRQHRLITGYQSVHKHAYTHAYTQHIHTRIHAHTHTRKAEKKLKSIQD